MILEKVLGRFDLVADAPGAVGQLRSLMLRLAVRGKLVPQLSSDGTADDVLRRIAQQQKRSLGTDVFAASQWYEVPSSWRWVSLASLGEIVGGGTPRSDNPAYYSDKAGIPWLTPADLNGFSEKRIFRGRRFITKTGLAESSARLLPEGAVLFSSRAPIGYVAIAGTELATNQGFKSCVPFIRETNEYLYYYLMSAAERIDREAPGTTFREVSGKLVSQIPVALPPLAEQKRIVAKVDELMALCDRLDAQQKERETRHSALAEASLARFADAPTAANLTFLFQTSYTIPPADLRKVILELALRGKLVGRDANDQPARATFPRLAAASVIGDDRDFPRTWLQVPLREIGEWRGGGTPSKSRADYWTGDLPWVSPKDMKALHIFDAQDHISSSALEDTSVRLIPEGSLLMVVRGMILARAFPVALTRREVTINQDMKALLPIEPRIKDFLLLVLRALEPTVLQRIERSSHGTCKLKTESLHELLIPIPPLAEQRRIVAKVDQLMALVDQLEGQLAASRKTAANLLDAVVAELTA